MLPMIPIRLRVLPTACIRSSQQQLQQQQQQQGSNTCLDLEAERLGVWARQRCKPKSMPCKHSVSICSFKSRPCKHSVDCLLICLTNTCVGFCQPAIHHLQSQPAIHHQYCLICLMTMTITTLLGMHHQLSLMQSSKLTTTLAMHHQHSMMQSLISTTLAMHHQYSLMVQYSPRFQFSRVLPTGSSSLVVMAMHHQYPLMGMQLLVQQMMCAAFVQPALL
mmetsp:Transcript_44139/g.78138  ORF Transcript_44139/g.78138 Transcript_44139/m.78138 type:complete len:220 (+) Transcript_44139:129-788(+)